MLKRRISLLLSLLFHTLLLAGANFVYQNIKEPKPEKRIVINLCQCAQSANACPCEKTTEAVKVQKEELPQKEQPKKVAEKKVQPTEAPVEQKVMRAQSQEQKVEEQPQKSVIVSKPLVASEPTSAVVSAKKSETPVQPKQQVQTHSKEKEYVQNNLAQIHKILQENLYYPMSARKRGIQGQVVVKFTLLKNAQIKDIVVVKESKEILNDAAIKTVESLEKKLPPPTEELTLEVPINYQLH
jgi:protein TonB